MKVHGDVNPGKFDVYPMPKHPKWVLARFYENAVEEDTGWEYDEYHLELPDTGDIKRDIEGNFETYFKAAKEADKPPMDEQLAEVKAAVSELEADLEQAYKLLYGGAL